MISSVPIGDLNLTVSSSCQRPSLRDPKHEGVPPFHCFVNGLARMEHLGPLGNLVEPGIAWYCAVGAGSNGNTCMSSQGDALAAQGLDDDNPQACQGDDDDEEDGGRDQDAPPEARARSWRFRRATCLPGALTPPSPACLAPRPRGRRRPPAIPDPACSRTGSQVPVRLRDRRPRSRQSGAQIAPTCWSDRSSDRRYRHGRE